MIIAADPGPADFIGSFVRGEPETNAAAARELMVITSPSTDSGRVLLYLCPECADIGCGAYGARVSRESGAVSWNDFAYENGYEEPKLIELGPFTFEARQYDAAIASASAL
jgi:hypothetical protein